MSRKNVETSVKDENLIEMRRDQIVKAAVELFTKKGFHRTTTREIAKASGFSIGTLYEYIRCKEDVLYLVCDDIYNKFKQRLEKDFAVEGDDLEGLAAAIKSCVKVMDEMQDEILVMYQEAKSLSKDALPYVLNKETEMAGLFDKLLTSYVKANILNLSEREVTYYSHHILVQCQMWAFRRWGLRKIFTRGEYAESLVDVILSSLSSRKLREEH